MSEKIFFLLLFFIVGSVFGSFLNVLIDRLSTGRRFVKGRSYCEKCKKTLKPKDLIPLLSFILLKGKCRYCKTKIPKRLFVVELLTGITFVGVCLQVLSALISIPAAIFLSITITIFIGIFFADIEYGIIPDSFILTSIVSVFFFLYFTNADIFNNFIAGFFTFIFFIFLFLVTKGKGMGFGDVKLSFVLGFLLGFPQIIVCLYLAFLTGAIVSIILVIWKKMKFFGGTIPFGPFLVASTLLTLFFGNQILLTFYQTFMS